MTRKRKQARDPWKAPIRPLRSSWNVERVMMTDRTHDYFGRPFLKRKRIRRTLEVAEVRK